MNVRSVKYLLTNRLGVRAPLHPQTAVKERVTSIFQLIWLEHPHFKQKVVSSILTKINIIRHSSNFLCFYTSRDGAEVARKAHNLEPVGSIPTPATECRLCAVSNLFRVNLRSVYRYKTVTYEALVELSSKNLCKASSFVGKQGHFI